MKKMMFNDKYGLTQAVLEGRKTMTRRIVPDGTPLGNWSETENKARFKVGEIVAVAQSYGTILDELEDPRNFSCMEHWESKSGDRAKYAEMAMYSPGGNNKMFVLAEEMPHQIRITNVRVERLQDISDGDVYKEGFSKEAVNNGWGNYAYHYEAMLVYYDKLGRSKEIRSRTPRDAYADLIDKVSGKGTWASNPWVFVYEFELVK